MTEDEIRQQYVLDLLDNMSERRWLDSLGLDQDQHEAEVFDLRYAAISLKAQYEADIEKAKTDADYKKTVKETTENLAKALPGITKGTLSAITAFQKGDTIGGSAATMDIFASLAPFLGGLAAGGGPPGMLLGAIFSMVGEILRFFGPKPESLSETLRKELSRIQAEDAEMNILAFYDDVTIQVNSLNKGIREYKGLLTSLEVGNVTLAAQHVKALILAIFGEQDQAALANILIPKRDAPDIAGTIDVVRKLVESFNPVTMDLYWKTHAWLSKPQRQNNDLWPVVLDLWCRTYINLLTSVVQIASLVKGRDKEVWIALAPQGQEKRVEESLSNLWSSGRARLHQFGETNRLMLQKLAALRPAAQNRGMLWHVGFSHEMSGIVHPVWAGNDIRQGKSARITDDTLRISAAKDHAFGQPTYHLFHVGAGGDVQHMFFPPPYTDLGKGESLPSVGRPSDLWAVSGGRPDLPPNGVNKDEVCFYATRGNKILGYLRGEDGALVTFYDRDVPSPQPPFTSVRAVHKPAWLLGDPDDKTESPKHPGVTLPGLLAGTAYIVYGLQHQGNSIHVDQKYSGESPAIDEGWVQGPWKGNSIAGVGVDQHYLWAFAPLSIACTTHASVISALKRYRATGQNQTPRWIHAQWPSEITSDPNLYPVTKGLADLSPCDDGTLVAAVFAPRKTVQVATTLDKEYDHDINRSLYAAAYRADIEKGTIEVDEFTRISGEGRRVHKLPVFCWSEFESLRKTLEKLGPNL